MIIFLPLCRHGTLGKGICILETVWNKLLIIFHLFFFFWKKKDPSPICWESIEMESDLLKLWWGSLMNSLSSLSNEFFRHLHFWRTQVLSTPTIIKQIRLSSAIQKWKNAKIKKGGFGWGITDDVTLQAIWMQARSQWGSSIYTTPAMFSCLILLMHTLSSPRRHVMPLFSLRPS